MQYIKNNMRLTFQNFTLLKYCLVRTQRNILPYIFSGKAI